MWFFHLLILLVVYSFGPGMLLVRPLRLAPRERVIVAIGLGLFLNYILAFVLFANDLMATVSELVHVLVFAVSLVIGIATWRDWMTVLRSRQVRQMLLIWALLFVWGMLLLSMIRNFGGGTWGGDWVEHYQRFSFFFVGGQYDFKFIDQYPLPMRPPMMNVLTASLLSQAAPLEQMMEAYQVVFVFLNSLVYLPLAILLPRLMKLPASLARKTPWTLAAVLAASPMFAQNLTYTWTKLFAAYYAIAAIALYLRSMQRAATVREWSADVLVGRSDVALSRPLSTASDRSLTVAARSRVARSHASGFVLAFALLCIGFLVHFSVGPYGLFLGLHYLFAVWWKRPNKLREAGVIAAVSLLVFAAWFPWSIHHYGAKTTFTSTSAVSDSVKMTPAENAANIAKNFGNTIVPTIVQKPWLVWADDAAKRDIDLDQPSFAGKLRDFMFLIYQVSLPGGLGSVGWVVATYLLVLVVTRRLPSVTSVRRFWLAFIPIVYVAGVAVYGGVDRFGVAHICLQPMILIGLAMLSGGIWKLSMRWRGVLLVGLLADFALGVMLQMSLQHYLPQLEVFTTTLPDGRQAIVRKVIEAPDMPSRAAQNNAGDRLQLSLLGPRDFWGDRFRDGGLLPLQIAAGGMIAFFLFAGLTEPRSRRSIRLATVPPSSRSKKRKSRR